MMISKVSVIIPTYNSSSYLSDAIQSVLNQTYRDIEIIVVDDGSTDNSKEIVDNYETKVRYIYQENKGPSAARNTGIANAKGDYIAFLDADDIWLPIKLELQLKEMMISHSVGLVTCGRFEINGIHIRECVSNINKLSRKELFNKLSMSNIIGGGSSVLVKRECFEIVGLFDEELMMAEDWDMWFRIVRKYELREVNIPLIKHRKINNSQSCDGNRNLINEIKFLKKLFANEEFSGRWYLKSKTFSHRYFCAAWVLENSGNRIKATLYILKALSWNPLYFLSQKAYFGLLIRIILGNTIFRLLTEGVE